MLGILLKSSSKVFYLSIIKQINIIVPHFYSSSAITVDRFVVSLQESHFNFYSSVKYYYQSTRTVNVINCGYKMFKKYTRSENVYFFYKIIDNTFRKRAETLKFNLGNEIHIILT